MTVDEIMKHCEDMRKPRGHAPIAFVSTVTTPRHVEPIPAIAAEHIAMRSVNLAAMHPVAPDKPNGAVYEAGTV